jgi:methoxymalonate biosynthesis acyl carrier protein
MSAGSEITEHIVTRYLPGTHPEELDPSLDLFDTGVVTSLQLLEFIDWLRNRYEIPFDELEISPDNFRSVAAIVEFIAKFKQSTIS